MGKILLVNYYFSEGECRLEPHNADYGIGRLSAYLREPGIFRHPPEVSLKSRGCPPPAEFIAECIAEKPDVIGLSCFVWNHKHVERAVQAFRDSLGECLVVLGGPSAPYLYNANKGFGGHPVYAIEGPGEESLARFIRLVEEGKCDSGNLLSVSGVHGFVDGNVFRRAPEFPAGASDHLPSPFKTGVLKPEPGARGILIEGSTICPRKCAYCTMSRRSGPACGRFFSPRYIKGELEWAVKTGMTFVELIEPSVGGNPERLEELVRAILEADPRGSLRFHLTIHPKDLTAEVAAYLRKISGRINSLGVGIQSLTPEAMKLMHRRAAPERLLPMLAEWGEEFPVRAELIAGLPGDNPDAFEASVEAILKLPVGLAVYRLLVMPGTEFFERSGEYGLRYDRDRYFMITDTPAFSSEYLSTLRKRLVGMFPKELQENRLMLEFC